MSATLALVATALETAAGASTSTNPNEPGYWKRIASAVEALAGATTSANDVPSGYMLRSALALESIAGTSGTEENSNYSGLLKRIVDALEVQSGAVEVGSLEHRLLLGAQNATFGGGEPVSLWPQPEFDSAVGLTLNGWTVAGGEANSNSQTGFLTATAVEEITPGTYRVFGDETGNIVGDGQLVISVAGTSAPSPIGAGPFDSEFEIVSVLNQLIRLRDADEAGITLASFNVTRVG